MRRIFVKPEFLSVSLKTKILILSRQEEIRIYKILRLAVGDKIDIFDGDGRMAYGVLSGSIIKEITLISSCQTVQTNLCLYQALVSTSKLETIVKYSTQLGVVEIILFNSSRCQFNVDVRVEAKIIRLRRIAEDFSRQSGRLIVPKIRYAFLPFDRKSEKNYVCVPKCSALILSEIKALSIFKYSTISIAVGPEGGFSNTEINRYLLMGGETVFISNNILRVEVASLVAIAYILKRELR